MQRYFCARSSQVANIAHLNAAAARRVRLTDPCGFPFVRCGVQNENKFMCPCHGSQYDQTGKVVRGPAPLSLALAHITDNKGVVTLSPWTETDFRTGLKPWWK